MEWKEKFVWLDVRKNQSFCTICETKLANNITNLERHCMGLKHKTAENVLKNQPQIDDQKQLQAFKQKRHKVGIAEIKIIVFLCLHNLPFTLMTPLIELIKSIANNHDIVKDLKCSTTKAADTIKNDFFEVFNEEISSGLRQNKFSLIIDEATDVSTCKCLAMIARFFDHSKGKIRDRFLGLLQLESSDSKSIFNAIQDFFAKNRIPFANCIGFAADNASVMMGNIQGVKARLKNLNPHLYVVGCICHSMHLCCSAASKAIPSNVEHLVRDIYMFFAHSSKRQREFSEFQEYFDMKKHKILKRANTRWLSLEAAVQRILEQWQPLISYFRVEDFDQNSDMASHINEQLNYKNKCYLLFLSYALKAIIKINLEFQSESPRFHILLETLNLYLKNILNNVLLLNEFNWASVNEIDLDDCSLYKPITEMYLGPQVAILLQSGSLNADEIYEIRINCQKFYIILAKEIIKRINFQDDKLKAVQILNPTSLGPSLVPLMQAFPNLIENDELLEELESEWRMLILQECENKQEELEDFWQKIFLMKNALKEIMYPNIKKFISSVLSLPHSSASTERVFSQMKLIKTFTRNSLKVETVNSLLLTREIVPQTGFNEWMPPKALIKKYSKE